MNQLKIINQGIIQASPRKLQAAWTIESVEEGLKYHRKSADDFIRIATNFLIAHYTMQKYILHYGGPQCVIEWDEKKYRPRYTVDIKITGWFIELYGEDGVPEI